VDDELIDSVLSRLKLNGDILNEGNNNVDDKLIDSILSELKLDESLLNVDMETLERALW